MVDKICHHDKKPCINHQCPKWINLLGTNPQTGVEENRWDCADAFMPVLLIEIAKETRQAGAAIESFRNEMVKSNQEMKLLQQQQAKEYKSPGVRVNGGLIGSRAQHGD